MRKNLTFQRGFSLVELMVAVVLGLLLTIVVSTIFLGGKQTFKTQDDLSRVQENGRFALDLLGRTVRLAGYMDDPTATPGFLTVFDPTAATKRAVDGVDGTASAADEITVRYAGSTDLALRDCGDQPSTGIPTGVVVTNRFYVDGGTLKCDSSGTGLTAGTYALIDGVEDFQVKYGEDTDTTRDLIANRYVDYGDVSNWGRLVSVRVCLILKSTNTFPDISSVGQTYYPCFSTSTTTATDGYIRRVYNSTITLRNQAPLLN